MTVGELAQRLEMRRFAAGAEEREITGGLMCDIISMAIAKGFEGMAWITHQANMNALAAAHWTQAACVVFPVGIVPERDVTERARKEGITLLGARGSAFETAGKMYGMGLCPVKTD